jgi:hypothetical protein
MTYRYSIIRFVPDPARAESVNLGLLAGDEETGDWDLRVVSNFRRARAIDTAGALPGALAFIARLEEYVDDVSLDGVTTFTTDALNHLSIEMRNTIQLTSPSPVVAKSAEDAIDGLFDELLVDPAGRRFRFAKKNEAVGSTRRAYRQAHLSTDAVAEKVVVHAGPYEQTFDFVVHNGDVVQLVQCWSFQLPNQDDLAQQVKAWAWAVREIRESKDSATAGEDLSVRDGADVDVAAVVIEPRSDDPRAAWDEAVAAFEEVRARAVPPDDADQIANVAAGLLQDV